MVVYFPGAAFVQLLLVMLLLSAIATLAAATQAKPGCQYQCGDVSIPYPFGIGDNCSLTSDFNISCRNSAPYLGNSNIQITNISTAGELHILNFMAAECYNQSGISAELIGWLTLAKFRISKSKNKFAVIGCDSYGYLNGYINGSRGRKWYSAGCISSCYQRKYVDDSACSGSGCCQMDIPDGLYSINLTAGSFYKHNQTLDFSPCTYSLVVEQSEFKFSSKYLRMSTDKKFPVVLDWAIDDDGISNSVCQENSTRYRRDNARGYLCKCEHGYRGNPFNQIASLTPSAIVMYSASVVERATVDCNVAFQQMALPERVKI